MTSLLWRATTRVPVSGALRQQLAPCRIAPTIPFPNRHGLATREALRPFTSLSGTSILRKDATSKAKELNQESVERHEQQVAHRQDAQRMVDDRPWQREGNHAQPRSTSPDPSNGATNKGQSRPPDT
jgi:hypothetical protein